MFYKITQNPKIPLFFHTSAPSIEIRVSLNFIYENKFITMFGKNGNKSICLLLQNYCVFVQKHT